MKFVAVVSAVVLGAAACGGDHGGEAMADHGGSSAAPSAPAGAATGAHNDQDVMFAQMMIPHHRQAVEMAALAPSRAGGPELRKLAGQIKRAQDPEIQSMSGWLRQWGIDVPESGEDMGGMHHGGAMAGMMSGTDLAKLRKAKGAAFDRMFATMMIKHHQGAIAMARQERSKGSYPPAKTMAASIISGQQAEITTMRGLLKR